MKRIWILFTMALFIFVSTHAQVRPLPPQPKPERQLSPEQPGSQRAQVQTLEDLKQSVEALQTASADLTSHLDKEDKEKVETLLKRTEVNLNYLLFSSIGKQDVPPEYSESLRLKEDLLRKIREQPMGQEQVETLTEVAADVEVKADSAQQCKDRPYQKIDITAYTGKGKDDYVDGFEVWWVDDSSRGRLAGGKSNNPIIGPMVPGNYTMWAQDPSNDQRSGNKKPFTVTCAGDKEVSLPVP